MKTTRPFSLSGNREPDKFLKQITYLITSKRLDISNIITRNVCHDSRYSDKPQFDSRHYHPKYVAQKQCKRKSLSLRNTFIARLAKPKAQP